MFLFNQDFWGGFQEAGLTSLAVFGIYYVYKLMKQQHNKS